MEHEIFNSDDEEIVEQKGESKGNLLNTSFLPMLFAMISLCISFLNKFLAWMIPNQYLIGVFFFLACGAGLIGLIFEIVHMTKNKKITFSVQLILNMFAILVSII